VQSARELTDRWIAADRTQFAIMCVGFVALLRAFSMPIAERSRD
jgi:hypothetical protein